MKKICGLLLIILTLASMLIVGCSKEAKLKESTMPANGIIRISPSTLFQGDTKKLEPHLGLISGCVNVKYSGPKKFIQTSYEIWEEGKLKKTSYSVGSLIQSNFDGEVSVSLKNESSDGIKQAYRLTVGANGGYSSGIIPEILIPNLPRYPLNINQEIEISDDKEIAIWGYVAQEDGTILNDESIEESTKKASWAIVIKLSMKDEHF